jgi:hypothetical protein
MFWRNFRWYRRLTNKRSWHEVVSGGSTRRIWLRSWEIDDDLDHPTGTIEKGKSRLSRRTAK